MIQSIAELLTVIVLSARPNPERLRRRARQLTVRGERILASSPSPRRRARAIRLLERAWRLRQDANAMVAQ